MNTTGTSLEIVVGVQRNPLVTERLVETLVGSGINGTLYIGYPVLQVGDESTSVDALLVSQKPGLVAFATGAGDPATKGKLFWDNVKDEQDRLYFAIANSLGRDPTLRAGRKLGVEVNVVTFFPGEPEPPQDFDRLVASPTSLRDVMRTKCEPVTAGLMRPLRAALQRVSSIRPAKKRKSAVTQGSRGAILKVIEKEIANLDFWQSKAAIECPDGPQRIRGLAGSGKTIVVALKAAYLHATHPDWRIAVTFHTRSLYQQFTELVRRFVYAHSGDEPDFDKLQIRHAWGGATKSGLYADIAACCELPARDFAYAKSTFGLQDRFEGICRELLVALKDKEVTPLYDVVLIDEAQDLPLSFFKLVHRFTREPKRIVLAYDELQNLTDAAPAVSSLFGTASSGQQSIDYGTQVSDISLPVCYRNTPWALTLAHALGFGIYRKGGLVQLFDDQTLWEEIGYDVIRGRVKPGSNVVLKRSDTSYPKYFEELLTPEDAVGCAVLKDESEQAKHLATCIKTNLTTDELEADDVLIILPDPMNAVRQSKLVAEELEKCGIRSHVAGVTASQDQIFAPGSVAISNIYRAKGNEAPMVYLLNSQYCLGGAGLMKLRNTIFTAITRSRAWVRILGWGPDMEKLKAEMDETRNRGFRLEFRVPTKEALKKLWRIHRERTPSEQAKFEYMEKALVELADALQNGDLAPESIDPELLQKLRAFLVDGDVK